MSSVQQTPDPQDPAEGDASAAAADSAAPVRPVRQLRTRGPVRQPKRGTDVDADSSAPAVEATADEGEDAASEEPLVARPVRPKAARTSSPRPTPSDEVATTTRPAAKRPAPKKPAPKNPAAKRPAAARTTPPSRPADASVSDTDTETDSSPAALDANPNSAAAPTPTKPSARKPPAARTTARSTTKRAVRAPKAGQKADAAQQDVAAPSAVDEREPVEAAPESSAVRAPRTAAAELVRDAVAVAPASTPARDVYVAPVDEPVTDAPPVDAVTADVAESDIAVEFVGAPLETDEPAEGLDSSTDLVQEFEAIVAPPVRPAPRKKRPKVVLTPAPVAPPETAEAVLQITGLSKSFGDNHAVDGIDLTVRTGSFYGIVGPNGAGKTTTLSMVTGLLRPDAGSVLVHDIDVWAKPAAAKRVMGVLPDRLRLFDRLTGAQLLYYSGVLRGLDTDTVRSRSADLVSAFGLEEAVNRLVADYSAGMTKKIALACAMIHSPRLLVLDEPFESVDPVSAANLVEILQRYVGAGGTVVLSSHGMDMIERVCDSVAVIIQGKVLASGTLDEVRRGQRLEDRFVELAGGRKVAEGMEWLHSFSD